MKLDQFNCEDCTYSCKSKPALSRHKTMKHKVIVNKNQKKLFNGMLPEKKTENKKEVGKEAMIPNQDKSSPIKKEVKFKGKDIEKEIKRKRIDEIFQCDMCDMIFNTKKVW